MSGIEILGLAASVVQIAELGGQLSVKLFTFTRKVKNANKSIDALSQDIAATGAVLQQLGVTLSKDDNLKVCSQQAIDTAKTLVGDTQKVFEKLEKLIRGDEKPSGRIGITLKQRLKFPFIESEIEQVQVNLERLKSSLLVVLNVLIFAEQLRNQEALPILQEQRQLISVLANEKDENERRYEQILKAIKDSSDQTEPSNAAASAGTEPTKSDASIDTTSTLVNFTTSKLESLTMGSRPQENNRNVVSASSNITSSEKGLSIDTSTIESSAPTVPSYTKDDKSAFIPTTVSSTTRVGNDHIHLPERLKRYLDPIRYHSDLVQNLLAEISSLHYQLDHGTRDRMLNGVLALHYDEWLEIRTLYGSTPLETILADYEDVLRYWTLKRDENWPTSDAPGHSFAALGKSAIIDESQVETSPSAKQATAPHTREDKTDDDSKGNQQTMDNIKMRNDDLWSNPVPSSSIPQRNHALQDYQMQLMLLEQQKRKRARMQKQAEEMGDTPHFSASDTRPRIRPTYHWHSRPSSGQSTQDLEGHIFSEPDNKRNTTPHSTAYQQSWRSQQPRQQRLQQMSSRANIRPPTTNTGQLLGQDFDRTTGAELQQNFCFDTSLDPPSANHDHSAQFDSEPQFNLDFSALEDSDVLENFDFDWFLAASGNRKHLNMSRPTEVSHGNIAESEPASSSSQDRGRAQDLDKQGHLQVSTIGNQRHDETVLKKEETAVDGVEEEAEMVHRKQAVFAEDDVATSHSLDAVDELIMQLTTINTFDLLRTKGS